MKSLPLYFIKTFFMKRFAFFMTAVAVLTACADSLSSQQEKAGRAATAFAEAYFNYDLQKAIEWTTPESAKWMSFVASNMTQEDVSILNSRTEGTQVTLTACEVLNDTTCETMLAVDNFLAADSIERPGELRDGGVFRLKVVLRDGNWKVKMEGLPRNEMRSHD